MDMMSGKVTRNNGGREIIDSNDTFILTNFKRVIICYVLDAENTPSALPMVG